MLKSPAKIATLISLLVLTGRKNNSGCITYRLFGPSDNDKEQSKRQANKSK